MPQRVCFIVLIGLPASGKTTFCSWLLKTHQSRFNVIHICYDDFLEEFYHQQPSGHATSLDFVYKARRSEIYKIIEIISNSLLVNSEQIIPQDILEKIKISNKCPIPNNKSDYIIVCDDNHYYRSMRYKIYQHCKKHSYAYAQIYFECDKRIAIDRNAQRNLMSRRRRRIPEHIIEQMAARLEVPRDSNRWESCTLTFNATELRFESIDVVLNLVLNAFNDVPNRRQNENNSNDQPTRQRSTEESTNSRLHALDIKLRREISEILEKERDKDNKRSMAIELNSKRKIILEECRNLATCLEDSDFDKYCKMLNTN